MDNQFIHSFSLSVIHLLSVMKSFSLFFPRTTNFGQNIVRTSVMTFFLLFLFCVVGVAEGQVQTSSAEYIETCGQDEQPYLVGGYHHPVTEGKDSSLK